MSQRFTLLFSGSWWQNIIYGHTLDGLHLAFNIFSITLRVQGEERVEADYVWLPAMLCIQTILFLCEILSYQQQ